MTRSTSQQPDTAQVDACITLLRELAGDRERLYQLDPARRRALLVAAGELSRPGRDALAAAARSRRKRERHERKRRDIALLAATGIRVGQRASYAPDLPLLPSPSGDADLGPELAEPRACYVCKAPYRRLHFFYHSMCPGCAWSASD